MSVANNEEAIKALSLARSYIDKGSLSAALKWARKSAALSPSAAADALINQINEDIASGASSTAGSSAQAESSTSAKATGAEAHPSAAGTHHRPGHGGSSSTTPNGDAAGKKSFTPEQHKVVKRVIACRADDYYAILAVEKTCSDADVRKGYRKLALALHPDKNGAPRADEAFKMVSKAFTVLSDHRAAYDSNPGRDPTSRSGGGGGGGGSGMSGFGGGRQGFATADDISPEDLFRAFFGGGGGFGGGGFDQFGGFGGGGPVFTFGNGGFQRFGGHNAGRARQQAGGAQAQPPPSWIQMLPLVFLFAIAMLSWLPSLFSTPDPNFTWSPKAPYTMERTTSGLGINYYVNPNEWQRHPMYQSVPEQYRDKKQAGKYSRKLNRFEQEIEQTHVSQLQQQCVNGKRRKQDNIERNRGFFGVGADWERIREIEQEIIPSCERLKELGQAQYYYNY